MYGVSELSHEWLLYGVRDLSIIGEGKIKHKQRYEQRLF